MNISIEVINRGRKINHMKFLFAKYYKKTKTLKLLCKSLFKDNTHIEIYSDINEIYGTYACKIINGNRNNTKQAKFFLSRFFMCYEPIKKIENKKQKI